MDQNHQNWNSRSPLDGGYHHVKFQKFHLHSLKERVNFKVYASIIILKTLQDHKQQIAHDLVSVVGSVGFFLECEDLEGKLDKSFPSALFCFVLFSELKSAHVHRFHSLGQNASKVAQRAEMTVDRCFLQSVQCI